MKLADLMRNKKFKKFLSMLYSIGASVVVLGALFKIQHWKFADTMLTAGLITEALIFFIYAFEVDDEESHDSSGTGLGLGLGLGRGTGTELVSGLALGTGSPALEKLDKMLEDAELTPELFFKLGEGMIKLSEATESITTMGNLSTATNSYFKTIKRADESLEKNVIKYKNISGSFLKIENSSNQFQETIGTMNANVSALNKLYTLQREGASVLLKEQSECAAESKKYHEEMKKLNENLAAMNQFYSNMLSVMKSK